MTMKGMKHTAESKARISAGQKRAWAKLKADAEASAYCVVRNVDGKTIFGIDPAEHSLINSIKPRCKRTFWQSLIALVMGGK